MIASLVMLVVAYSVSHRLFEFAWKGQLRTLFPSALAYQARARSGALLPARAPGAGRLGARRGRLRTRVPRPSCTGRT
jgi:hypothetical protein